MSNKNVFDTIEVNAPEVNTFDLSHQVKQSMNMGWLVPCLAEEVLPKDTWRLRANTMVRVAPLMAPIMERIDVYVHYFFCPNRINFPEWEKLITGSTLAGPEEGPPPAHPTLVFNDDWYNNHKLFDYLGLADPGPTNEYQINAFPFAAYQKIYNDYYRDQNLIPELALTLTPGNNSGNNDLMPLRRRAWEHDYFTSALPFAQKGSAISVPLGQISLNPNWDNGVLPFFVDPTGTPLPISDPPVGAITPDPRISRTGDLANSYALNPGDSLVSQGTNVNEIRRSFRLQEFLEKNARAGTRYTEYLLIHFNVRSSDARLQRPEYISGVKTPIIISEVLNSGGPAGDEPVPQGNMAGHGISISQDNYGSYYAEEHGWIIGIMSIMPRPSYQQGIPKKFMRNEMLDYAVPSFANLGEQEVLNSEVYAPSALPNGTFGYVPRYSEYKFLPNRVAGDFKTTLKQWGLTRIFDSEPALNQAFIECNPRTDIFAVEGTPEDPIDHFYCNIWHELSVSRALPYFGTPMI